MAGPEEIIKEMLNPSFSEKELVTKAFKFAQTAHDGHSRLSGDPYFIHLAETAKILAQYGMDSATISAGLLHDILEDTKISVDEIKKEFGDEVLFLIEGVTKLGKLKYRGADRYNESLRKLFVAVSQDIRVLMIKLCDRLHNMRTLSHVPEEKRKRIAQETLEIYAPIAYRLGIRKLSRELEDLAFPFVSPEDYEKTKQVIKQKYDENVENLEKFLKSVKKALAKEGLIDVKTDYRVKGFWSLFKKIKAKEENIEKIYDILAIRIIVKSVEDCYRALGIIHGSWRPLPGRIKDYIAFPKPNGYSSLHTTVFTGDGNIVEVQIRTNEMHERAEYGIASHISYKDGGKKKISAESSNWVNALLPKSAPAKFKDSNMISVPNWIKDIAKYHETDEVESFSENLRNDFFQYRIFVFTPKGDVIDLPKDSTPIDFAYSIHSDIGDHLSGAKVNGKLVSLDSILHGGDIVEIVTRPSAKPNRKWIEDVKTTMAKRHIRSALLKESRKGLKFK